MTFLNIGHSCINLICKKLMSMFDVHWEEVGKPLLVSILFNPSLCIIIVNGGSFICIRSVSTTWQCSWAYLLDSCCHDVKFYCEKLSVYFYPSKAWSHCTHRVQHWASRILQNEKATVKVLPVKVPTRE